jgi:hypothetical protein
MKKSPKYQTNLTIPDALDTDYCAYIVVKNRDGSYRKAEIHPSDNEDGWTDSSNVYADTPEEMEDWYFSTSTEIWVFDNEMDADELIEKLD